MAGAAKWTREKRDETPSSGPVFAPPRWVPHVGGVGSSIHKRPRRRPPLPSLRVRGAKRGVGRPTPSADGAQFAVVARRVTSRRRSHELASIWPCRRRLCIVLRLPARRAGFMLVPGDSRTHQVGRIISAANASPALRRTAITSADRAASEHALQLAVPKRSRCLTLC